jgi:multidrug efflux pump subunit AcrA (membrane-fusion protein)
LLLEIAKANVSPSAPIFKQLEANLKAAEQKLKQEKQQAERYKTLYVSNSVSKLEFENAQLAYETANSNYISLSENYKFQKQQSEQQLISQQTQSEVNKVLQGNNDLRAVIGGKIYNKYKELGDYVRRGEVIAVIGDPKNIYARLSIDESSFSKVQLKQQVIIQLNIDKHKNYNGEITEIYPSFDSKSQSFNCKVKFIDSLLFGVSGTQVQANIITNRKDNILVIPRKYLDYGNTVIIKETGKVKVKTGFISNEWVEIVSGLDEKSIIQIEKK